MVEEFEREILKHKRGEIFPVDARFGRHIVKVLENPVKDSCRVYYVILQVRNR